MCCLDDSCSPPKNPRQTDEDDDMIECSSNKMIDSWLIADLYLRKIREFGRCLFPETDANDGVAQGEDRLLLSPISR